ncbi:MAG: tRNA (adenosine(37)-N6)-dimethylallyltransferase MiaA [Bacteroidetes bacterium]|nr:MAG: tRNA (adenosine(37)-N6)-dimethylallyltransferase MiaA [Bacteroidota bacterium]
MKNLITILGPTATGKTKLATALAAMIGGEIISADSRQVYRGMDIGTGKDIEDYRFNGQDVPYHLIDIVDPGYEYNIFEYQKHFTAAFNDIVSRDKIPVLAGGSGLYLDAVINGYALTSVPEDAFLRKQLDRLSDDELREKLKSYGQLHNTTDLIERSRIIRAIEIKEYEKLNPNKVIDMPDIDSVTFGISYERQEIRQRITDRLVHRLNHGMIEEVEHLLGTGLKPEQLTFYGLEYKWLTLYVTGQILYDEMFANLNTAIHQFAKRQMTWFRRMEKKGTKIYWIDGAIPEENKLNAILKVLATVKF